MKAQLNAIADVILWNFNEVLDEKGKSKIKPQLINYLKNKKSSPKDDIKLCLLFIENFKL